MLFLLETQPTIFLYLSPLPLFFLPSSRWGEVERDGFGRAGLLSSTWKMELHSWPGWEPAPRPRISADAPAVNSGVFSPSPVLG